MLAKNSNICYNPFVNIIAHVCKGEIMKKLLVALSILVLVLAGCGGSDEVKSIVVYSNSVGDQPDAFNEVIEAGNFPFEVEVVSMGGNEMKDRLISEKNNPQADVVLGGSQIEQLALVENDILSPYKPAWADQVPQELVGADDMYYPFSIDTAHFVYNKNLVGDDKDIPVPTEWTDLLAPEWTDNYYVFGSGGTTGGMIYSSILSEYRDDSGDLGISDEGWEVIGNVIENGIPEPEDFRAALLNDDIAGGFVWGGAVLDLNSRGGNLAVMQPEAGTIYYGGNISLVNTGDEQTMEAAKQFIDFWGSEEAQTLWLQTGQIPANQLAYEKGSDEMKAFMNELTIQDIDWNFVFENLDKWRERIALDYGM